MCDILYIPPSATQSGNLLFAKNSDREPDEAQAIEYIPRQIHRNTKLSCTFITIPQVKETYACILSRPFHMWGAEMGVNEHGVVIGNEAVFTRIKFKRDNSGLTGMDMLRLALERCASAQEALQCITDVLETYGQDACGGYRNKRFYYHNSFLIADTDEAFVLETAGKHWAVEKVDSIRSLSNCLSIHAADKLSPEAEGFALQKKWIKRNEPFSFAKAYSDWLFTRLGRGSLRAHTTCTLAAAQQPVTAHDCMKILQSHNLPDSIFTPSRASTASVCMHATGLLNPSETTGSMVAEIRKNKPHTVWLTGTPHPCLSVYIPFFFVDDNPLIETGIPSEKPDGTLWWIAKNAHRVIARRYQQLKSEIDAQRQELQHDFLKTEQQLIRDEAPTRELERFSRDCIQRVCDFYNQQYFEGA